MKNIIVLLSCFVIVTTGCKKDSALKSLNQQLTGKWELTRSFGGWTREKTYEPGNGNTIMFNSNTLVQYLKYDTGLYTINATYNIYQGKPCDFAAETTLIHYKTIDNNEYDNEISLTDGELKIANTQCIADGSTNYYRRIE